MQTVNDVLSQARADAVEALLEPDVDVALARSSAFAAGGSPWPITRSTLAVHQRPRPGTYGTTDGDGDSEVAIEVLARDKHQQPNVRVARPTLRGRNCSVVREGILEQHAELGETRSTRVRTPTQTGIGKHVHRGEHGPQHEPGLHLAIAHFDQ